MATARYLRGDVRSTVVPVATDKAVEVGDIVGLSSGTLVLASDTTWDTDLATTQTAFALLFIGASMQKKVDDEARVQGNGADNIINVGADGIWEFNTASASYTVGQLVGPAKATGGRSEGR
jgi:hypothetical protein